MRFGVKLLALLVPLVLINLQAEPRTGAAPTEGNYLLRSRRTFEHFMSIGNPHLLRTIRPEAYENAFGGNAELRRRFEADMEAYKNATPQERQRILERQNETFWRVVERGNLLVYNREGSASGPLLEAINRPAFRNALSETERANIGRLSTNLRDAAQFASQSANLRDELRRADPSGRNEEAIEYFTRRHFDRGESPSAGARQFLTSLNTLYTHLNAARGGTEGRSLRGGLRGGNELVSTARLNERDMANVNEINETLTTHARLTKPEDIEMVSGLLNDEQRSGALAGLGKLASKFNTEFRKGIEAAAREKGIELDEADPANPGRRKAKSVARLQAELEAKFMEEGKSAEFARLIEEQQRKAAEEVAKFLEQAVEQGKISRADAEFLARECMPGVLALAKNHLTTLAGAANRGRGVHVPVGATPPPVRPAAPK